MSHVATQESPKPPASSDEDSGQDLKDYQEIPSVSCTDVEVITSSKDENEELQSLDEDKFKSQLEDEADDEIEKVIFYLIVFTEKNLILKKLKLQKKF